MSVFFSVQGHKRTPPQDTKCCKKVWRKNIVIEQTCVSPETRITILFRAWRGISSLSSSLQQVKPLTCVTSECFTLCIFSEKKPQRCMEADHTFSNNTVHCILSVKKPAPEKKSIRKAVIVARAFPKIVYQTCTILVLAFSPGLTPVLHCKLWRITKKGEKDLEKSDIYFSIQI